MLSAILLFNVVILGGVTHLHCKKYDIDPAKCEIWGPGLMPDKIVMPARYFFIQAVDKRKNALKASPGNVFLVKITGDSTHKNCRVWINTLDRKDGSFIIRYKTYHTCYNVKIHVTYENMNVGNSPYSVEGPVYPDECYCPVKSIEKWTSNYGCKNSYDQISSDLKFFKKVNFTKIRPVAIKEFNHPGSMSICNYVIKENKVYRKCYGKYIGFKMFLDAILLSLARKVYLPDMEILFNLGDWPLARSDQKPRIPLFSWCGSDESLDIVMPTYDITEATLECMGRVMLDMLSVQGNIEKPWNVKIEKGFWRGRDSRRERLQLIDIARKQPDLLNASLTNFFFFKNEEDLYGPKEKHISFFKFFDYKYQINIDGTVAAYRFPYLLAGDSLVFKQDSTYYEHFYKQLKPWKHYIPFKSNLSDLIEKLQWAKNNDAEALKIARNGQKFAQENLMPQDIFCYHAVLFKEWSTHLVEEVIIMEDMEQVPQPELDMSYEDCNCHRLAEKNERLLKEKQQQNENKDEL